MDELVSAEDFDDLVRDAIDELPEWVEHFVEDIVITVDDLPPAEMVGPGRTLLGLYRGVPRTRYGGRPPGSMPDTITLYRLPILATCRDAADVPARVLKVLGHEVGHAFGLSDERLRELGWY
jgi:predicted Zn-dependent protease with MMP-like domain